MMVMSALFLVLEVLKICSEPVCVCVCACEFESELLLLLLSLFGIHFSCPTFHSLFAYEIWRQSFLLFDFIFALPVSENFLHHTFLPLLLVFFVALSYLLPALIFS